MNINRVIWRRFVAPTVKGETMAEDRNHWLYVAAGWTIAAALFTAYAFCRGDSHTQTSSGLGWLVSLYLWGVVMYEGYKTKKGSTKH